MTLDEIELIAAECTQCDLSKTRTNPVFARGNPKSRIMICGMVPGPDENEAGIPFVGRAGQLLNKIVEYVGMVDPYITNLVKCWLKPGLPLKDEWIAPCLQYILAQIFAIKPRVILTLGLDASKALIPLSADTKMARVRGNPFHYTTCEMTPRIDIIPTYHPSYLLRGGGEKHDKYSHVIEDFELAQYIVKTGGDI
jgi:DNA polymerase